LNIYLFNFKVATVIQIQLFQTIESCSEAAVFSNIKEDNTVIPKNVINICFPVILSLIPFVHFSAPLLVQGHCK
jgi:hypothetical protein